MVSGKVGLNGDPDFSLASASRLDSTIFSSQSFNLSGSMSLVFSPSEPPTFDRGSLIAEKISETIPITAADIPTVITVLVGFGTQTCCNTSVEPDCEGVDGGVVVACEELLGVDGEGETNAEGLAEGDALEASEITESVPSP